MHKTVSTVSINEIEEVSCTVNLLKKAILNSDSSIAQISHLSTGNVYLFIDEVQYWLTEIGAIRVFDTKTNINPIPTISVSPANIPTPANTSNINNM
jgi:hypothetical protein